MNPSTWQPSADSPCSRAAVASADSGRRAGRARRDHVHVRRQRLNLRQTRPRRRMRRIEADGLLEGAKRPGVVLLRISEVPRLQIAAISLEVMRLRPDTNGPFSRGETGLHGLDDSGGDLVLHSEHVRRVAIEALRPELIAAHDIGELRGHAKPVAGRPHAALEDVAHRERTRDGRQVAVVVAGPEGGGARCDADPVDADQRVHDLLGHPLAEVLLVLRGAHVREGQHRDRDGPPSAGLKACATSRELEDRGDRQPRERPGPPFEARRRGARPALRRSTSRTPRAPLQRNQA